MFEKEEKELMKSKTHYHDIQIPDEIDTYIYSGIEHGKRTKRRIHHTKLSTFTIAALLFLSIISIRVSPAFASLVSQVPGMERIIQFIQGDKGLERAVQNDFLQVVNKSVSHQGITFTINEVIADESQMIFFYSLESDESLTSIRLDDVKIVNEKGESMEGTLSYSPHAGIKKGKVVHGKMEVGMHDDVKKLPKTVTIQAKIEMEPNKKESSNQKWELTFPIDQEKFYGNIKTFELNKSVQIEGQTITFKTITVYPTRVVLHVLFDSNNTKQIFAFDDLAIVDENGEKWASIQDGITAEHLSENEQVLFIQSNYFTNPKELFIRFSSIRALDKNQLDVVVDLNKKKIVKGPTEGLTLQNVIRKKETTTVEFLIKSKEKRDANHHYQIFDHEYRDETGATYEWNELGSSSGESELEFTQLGVLTFPAESNQLFLKIIDYPTRVKGNVKVKIK